MAGLASNAVSPANIGPASSAQQANSPSAQSGSTGGNGANSQLPFTSSARKHREQMALSSAVITAMVATQIPEQAIPAYGFLRGLWLRVVASGGAGTGAVASADGPWNVLGACSVTDPDGAPIWSVNSGYTAYLISKYGGYINGNGTIDPKLDGFYSAVTGTGGNFQFQLWVPLEITERNGLGSLPNTDSGKQYKLNLATNASTTVYSSPPVTTIPNVTISVFISAWTQPPVQDVLGRALTRVPPMVGSTQYWSRQSLAVNAGFSTGQTFGRVGNVVRGWLFVYRNSSGVRQTFASGNWPNPATVYRDGYNYDVIDSSNWLEEIAYKYGLSAAADAAGGPDNGVFPYMFIFDLDGLPGNELRGQYWPTLQSSRIELDGSYGVAGTLEVITNDIAPTGDLTNRVLF
jgi:hypothetical protein